MGNIDLLKIYAGKYFNKTDNTFEYDDLFQIACEGLLSACNYYVPSEEATFRTYASKCIDNKLKQFTKPKKKIKKQERDLEKIIKKEKDKLDFIKNCVTYLKYMDNSKSYSKNLTGIFEYIKKHNRNMRNLGEFERIIYKHKDDNIDTFVNLFTIYIKESFLPLLITNEDRELISLEINSRNVPEDLITITSFIEYINLYEQRMNSIYDYIRAINILKMDGKDIITKEDIVDTMNKKVKEINSLIFRYRKSKLVEYPHQKEPTCYYYEYLKEYGVNFLDSTGKSRANEIRDIEYGGYYLNLYEYIKNEYNSLLQDLYKENMNDLVIYSLKIYEDDLGYKTEYISSYTKISKLEDKNTDKSTCTVKELIELINKKLESLNSFSNDEYVREILKLRKNIITNKVKEINEPIYEYNRSIEANRDVYFNLRKYKKYYTLEDIDLIEYYIGIMFNYNNEKMNTLIRDDEIKKKQHTLSVEDTVCNNAFLNDYYNSLNSLDELQKQILLLWYDEEGKHSMSAKEISDIVGIPNNEVYKEKEKALRLLRKNKQLQSYLED